MIGRDEKREYKYGPLMSRMLLVVGLSVGIGPLGLVSLDMGPSATSRAVAQQAEALPATTPAEQPAPAAETPGRGWPRILEAEISTKLNLSDEQKSQLEGLLKQRQEVLAQANPQDRRALEADFNGQLRKVLNEDQAKQFDAWIAEANQPLLRFNFRFQPWSDVLDWFAGQAGLSLVLDAPPPGTFNYSDTKQYTPSEAIDLLNGVLLTKGYTLIRRERMLLVVSLEDGIPEELVERISLEDLDSRGRFEFVRVAFPTDPHTPQDVEAEITPLLGSHGKVALLPKSKQLVVTETAGKMKAIEAVIQSMPVPEKPPEPGKPKEPPAPVLAMYPLGTVEAAAAIELMQGLVGGAQIVHDPKSEQLMVYAAAEQQAVLKTVLEKMQADNPPEKRPGLKKYKLKASEGAALVEMLTTAVPEAVVYYDQATTELVAWAEPAVQDRIAEAVTELRGSGGGGEPELRVYPLKQNEASEMLPLLQSMLPTARLAVDSRTQSIVALGTASELEAIGKAIDRLSEEHAAQDKPSLEFYPVRPESSADLLAVLAQVAPQATLTYQASARRLAVLASGEDHPRIKAAIERLQGVEQDRPAPAIQLYPLEDLEPSSLIAVLGQITPDAQVTHDSAQGRLVVLATEADQAKIQATLEEFRARLDDRKPRLQSYEARGELRKRLTAVLESLATEMPGMRVIPAGESEAGVTVFATSKQHALIGSYLKQLEQQPVEGASIQLAVYPIRFADIQSVLSVLQTLLPERQFIVDAKTRQIVVRALPSEQQLIDAAIKQIDVDLPEEQRLKLMSHPLLKANVTTVTSILSSLLPELRVTPEAETATLVAWGTGRDHETIAEVIQRLQPEVPEAMKPRLEVYSIRSGDVGEAGQMIQTLVPTVRLQVNPAGRSVAALATPEEHATIRTLVEKLATSGENKRSLVVYPLDLETSSTALSLIQGVLPRASALTDPHGGNLLLWGTEEEQQQAAAALEKLTGEGASRRAMVIYPVRGEDRDSALAMVQARVPQARIVPHARTGNLVAWATTQEHALIKETLDTLANEPGRTERKLVIYPMRAEDSSNAQSIIGSLLPDARLMASGRTGNLLVWATDLEHEEVRKTLEQLASDKPESRSLEVYPLRNEDSATAITLVSSVAPTARIVNDVRTGNLLAWATEDEHDLIRKALETFSTNGDRTRQLTTYQVRPEDSANAVALLASLVPQVRVLSNPRTGNLLAWGTEEEHGTIKTTLDEIASDEAEQKTLVVYPQRPDESSNAATLLSRITPQALVTIESRSGHLQVWASAEDHVKIAAAFEKLAQDDRGERSLSIYPVPMNQSAALIQLLQTTLPSVTVVTDPQSGDLLAWATVADHQRVKDTLDKVARHEKDDREFRAYRLATANVTQVAAALRQSAPEATIEADTVSSSLMVWATTQEHEKLREAIDQLEQETRDLRELVVYEMARTDATSIVAMLQTLVPQARVLADPRSGNVMAWASAEDQVAIRGAIDRIEQGAQGTQQKKLQVHPLGGVDATAGLTLLQSALPRVQFALDPRKDALLAWAREEEHEQIRRSLEELAASDAPDNRAVARSYRLHRADASTAVGILQPTFPRATFAVDPRTGSLLVTAPATDHERIETTLHQLEGSGDDGVPKLKSYAVLDASPNNVLDVLQDVFAQTPGVRLSVDERTNRVIALATEAEHQTIQQIIDEIQTSASGDDSLELRAYRVEDENANSVQRLLEDLFADKPRVRISSDASGGQLLAIARPEDHVTIEETIAKLKGVRHELEVFNLEVVDPFSAQSSIENLLGERRNDPDAPKVEVDFATSQLFVRATPEQMEEVRQLLIKMGETELSNTSIGSDSKIRIIRMTGSEVEAAVREIQRVWPQLRKNPIRIVTPSAVAPTLRLQDAPRSPDNSEAPDGPRSQEKAPATKQPPAENPPAGDKPQPEKAQPGESQPEPSQPEPSTPQGTDQQGTDQQDSAEDPSKQSSLSLFGLEESVCLPREPGAASPDSDEADATGREPHAQRSIVQEKPSVQNPPTTQEMPAIIVAPGSDSITIASDDLEALDQFESLLRNVTKRAAGSSEFTVFPLSSADAVQAAETLQSVFRSGALGFRGGPTIVPDQRLNALIVQAGPNDLETIQGLIDVIDTDEVPQTPFGTQPRVIPLEHARAPQLYAVLQEVYKTQLTTGGRSQQMSVPKGVPRELAAALQQISQANTGPEMTLGFDEETNSLIVLAPAKLLAEVETLVQTMDTAAMESARTIKLVPLKQTNTEAIQRALDSLIQDGRSGGRRYRGRGRDGR